MKISEVIGKIAAYHPPLQREQTTDVIKYGDPDKECTGIVITCYASPDVIREATRLGANFIIVHEPVFYNHEDETDWLADSKIFQAKKKLLDDAGIVIWRDHDRIHGGRPMKQGKPYMDGIFYGIMHELGWEEYLVDYPNMPLMYKLPETTAQTLGQELKSKLNLNGIRIIGDKNAKVSKVYICEHIGGNDRDAHEKVLQTEFEDIDALIPLEIIDWTLCAFVRDACQLGYPKVMYNIGHFNFEEIGMKYITRWLPDLVGGTPVHYVQSGDSFSFII